MEEDLIEINLTASDPIIRVIYNCLSEMCFLGHYAISRGAGSLMSHHRSNWSQKLSKHMASNPLIDVRGLKNRKSLRRLFSVSSYSYSMFDFRSSVNGSVESNCFAFFPFAKSATKAESKGSRQRRRKRERTEIKKVFSFIFRKKTKPKQKVSNVEGLLIESGNKHKKIIEHPIDAPSLRILI